jgi:undecaprenyl-diphosphatase
MTIWQSIFLGAVQGITELLPISSSAHLLLIPRFLAWEDSGLFFDASLHIGTLLAVIYYFRDDLKQYLFAFFATFRKKKATTSTEKLAWYILFATFPGILAGFFLEEAAETLFRFPLVTAISLSVGALFLWYTDNKIEEKKGMDDLNFKSSLVIGVGQALALVPGISRSGITMSFGMLYGLTREASAKFSFLLSVPITLGAALYQFRKIGAYDVAIPFYLGIISSFLFGLLALFFLFALLKKTNFNLFVYYRLLLAILVMIFLI